MDAVGIQSQGKITYLTALKASPGIKVAVHMEGKLHGYFSSCKHMALLTACMLLSLSSSGNKGLQT